MSLPRHTGLGIATPLTRDASIALGTVDVNLLELTAAYAPFANGGIGVWAYGIAEIRDSSGNVLFRRSGSGPGRVVSPEMVGEMNDMLSGSYRPRHRAQRPVASTGRRQDRYHPGLPRCLVHRLYRRSHRRGVVWQRQQRADEQGRRRLAPRADLAQLYARGNSLDARQATAERPTTACRCQSQTSRRPSAGSSKACWGCSARHPRQHRKPAPSRFTTRRT